MTHEASSVTCFTGELARVVPLLAGILPASLSISHFRFRSAPTQHVLSLSPVKMASQIAKKARNANNSELTTVQNAQNNAILQALTPSINKINNIIAFVADSAEASHKAGKTQEMLEIINGPGYIASLDAINNIVNKLSISSDSPNLTTTMDTATTQTNSKYDVVITVKEGVQRTALQIYQEAIEKINIQASDWTAIDARSMKFQMMCPEYAEKLDTYLHSEKNNEGTPYADLVESSVIIKSAYAVKTVGFESDTFKKIKWITGTKVNLEVAIPTLVKHNHYWFRSTNEIENIELHSNRQSKHWITIFTSKASFDRFLSYQGNIRKISLDLDIRPIAVYEQIRHDYCYNCLVENHSSDRCHLPSRCRFCGLDHPSQECGNKKFPICFRCSITPSQQDLDDLVDEDITDSPTGNNAVDTPDEAAKQQRLLRLFATHNNFDHEALSNRCKVIRDRINALLATKRAAFRNQRNE